MDEKILSVIVPVYNVSDYLLTCIESIVNQSFMQIEIILVNDGSTDGSDKICEFFARSDARIKVIHQNNEGPIRARYNGLIACSCKYVTFVDGDDFISAHSYEYAISSIKENIDLIMFGIIRYHDRDNQTICTVNMQEGVYKRDEIVKEIFPKMIWDQKKAGFGVDPSLCTKIVKRELILPCYNEIKDMDFHYGEDMAVTYPLLLEKINTLEIKGTSYYYHRHREKGNIPAYLADKNFYVKLFKLYDYLKMKVKNHKEMESQLEAFYVYAVNLRYDLYHNSLKSVKYLFPFHKVEYGKRVILYGAGVVGQTYYKQVEKLNYCKIVSWIDKEYKKYNLDPVQKVSEVSFDYIVIAIFSKEVFQNVKNNLLDMGVDECKIVEY